MGENPVNDETRQGASEKDLLESLTKAYTILKGVVESPNKVVIFALDRQYRYLVFNKVHYQTMRRIWGVDIETGSSMLEYIRDPEDRMKAKMNFDRVLSGESFTVEEEYGDAELERRYYEDIYNPIVDDNGYIVGLTLFLTDITDRKRLELERERLIEELQTALKEVETLSGLIPICSKCKKIRDDQGYWNQVEVYIQKHSSAQFSHSICPDCLKEFDPVLAEKVLSRIKRRKS